MGLRDYGIVSRFLCKVLCLFIFSSYVWILCDCEMTLFDRVKLSGGWLVAAQRMNFGLERYMDLLGDIEVGGLVPIKAFQMIGVERNGIEGI